MNFWSHVGTVGALSLFWLGPLPLALWLASALGAQARINQVSGQHSLVLLSSALYWLLLQSTLATFMAVSGTFTLTSLLLGNVVWLFLGLGCRWLAPQPLPLLQAARNVNWQGLGIRFGLLYLTLCFVGLLLLGNLLLQPITDYDSLYYHLPFVANLHATGSIMGDPMADSVAPVVAWYPYGWETLGALLILPAKNDLFVALPNLLVWGLYGLGTYRLARQLGVRPMAAIAPVLLLLTQPLVLDQLNSLRVDLALGALVVSIAALLSVPGAARWAALGAIAILPAIKMSGLVYGALLFALLLLHGWPHQQPSPLDRASVPRHRLAKGLHLLLGIGVIGSSLFWYLRNWYSYGNPLGLLEVRVGSWTIFPGPITRPYIQQTTQLALFDGTDFADLRLYATAVWQQGHLPLLGLLLLASTLFWTLRKHGQRREILLLSAAILLLTWIYWITPYSGTDGTTGNQLNVHWMGQAMRFALPALGLFAVLAAVGTELIVRHMPGGAGIVTALALLLSAASVAQRSMLYLLALVVGGLLLLLAVGLLQRGWLREWPWRLWWPVQAHKELVGVAVVSLVLATVLILPWLQRVHSARRAQLYGPLPQLIDEHTTPGAVVAALYSHQSYLANGATLERQVLQVPNDVIAPTLLAQWLHAQNIRYFVVGPLPARAGLAPDLSWLDGPEQPHELIYDGGPAHPRLYRANTESTQQYID